MTRSQHLSRRRFLGGLTAGTVAGTSFLAAARRAAAKKRGGTVTVGMPNDFTTFDSTRPHLRKLGPPAESLRQPDALRSEPKAPAGPRREVGHHTRRPVGHADAPEGREVPQREGPRRRRRRQELRESGRQGSRVQHARGSRERRRGDGAGRRYGRHQVQDGVARGVRPAPEHVDHRAGRHGFAQEPRQRHGPVQVRRVGARRSHDPRAQPGLLGPAGALGQSRHLQGVRRLRGDGRGHAVRDL